MSRHKSKSSPSDCDPDPLDVVEQSVEPVMEDCVVHNHVLVKVNGLQVAVCNSLSSRVDMKESLGLLMLYFILIYTGNVVLRYLTIAEATLWILQVPRLRRSLWLKQSSRSLYHLR